MRQTSHDATAPNANRSVNRAGSCPPWASANSVALTAPATSGAGDRPGEPRGDRLAEIAAEADLLGRRLQRSREQDHNEQPDKGVGRRGVDVAETDRRDREARQRRTPRRSTRASRKNRPSTDHRRRPTTDASQPTGARCAAHTASIAAGINVARTRLLASSPSGLSGVSESSSRGLAALPRMASIDQRDEQDTRRPPR